MDSPVHCASSHYCNFFFLDYQTPLIVAAVLYVAYLAVRVSRWPRRYRTQKELKNEAEQAQDNWEKMMIAYTLCSPPVISPITLREHLVTPTNLGPPFSGAVYAILDRIISRDREVFLPFQTKDPTIVGEYLSV